MKLECLTPEFPQGARVYSVDGVAPSLLNSASAMRSQAILVSGGGSMKICESGPVICRASGQASADTLNETCPSTLLTLKMNNAASRYIMDHDKYGAPEALKRLEARTAHLMPEEFWLPAGGLVGSEKKLRVLAERRDAAKMIVRFFAESLEEMEYTPEQIETVKEEIKKNYQQFLGWVDDGGEEVAYDRLRRVIEDIYGVGAMVERVKGEEPVFGEPLFKKDF